MHGHRQPHHVREQQQSEATSFPLMQVDEIYDCLAALNIPIQKEDIIKPTASHAQHIYAHLVSEIMGAPMDMIEQPKAALLGMMEYREMYSDALSFTLFFRHARHLTETCGIRNFVMSDLTRPDGGRMRHHLSGIMNFAKYRDEKSTLQQELQEQNRIAADRYALSRAPIVGVLTCVEEDVGMNKLQKQLERVEANIADISAKNAADKPKTEEARAQNQKLRDELLDLRNSQMRLSHEVEELKKERMTHNETATGKVNDVNQLNLAISAARSRLVQSPDRIKKHINEMSYNVATDKATLANFQRKARELTSRLEIIGGLETDLKGLIDLSKGIEYQRSKVEEAKRALLALRAKLDGKDIESQSLITRTEQLQRQIQNTMDRHARSETNVLEMREKSGIKMKNLRKEYDALSKQRTVVMRERDMLVNEQKEIEAEMEAFVKAHEEELNALMEEYWTLRGQAEEYINSITTTLGLDSMRS